MAKKNNQKIVINPEELKPTVLYTFKEKRSSILGLIIIFAIFIAVVYFLPDISRIYEQYKKGNVNNIVVSNKDHGSGSGDFGGEEEIKYNLSEELIIENKDIKINTFAFNNNTLTFNIENKTGYEISFKNKKYFLEVYDTNDVLVGRFKLGEDKFAVGEVKNYSYPVTASGISYFLFKDLKIEDYPLITLIYDDNGNANMVCANSNSTTTYTFDEDGLISINEKINIRTTDNDYANKLTSYREKAATYSSYSGVTAELTTEGNSVVYNINITSINNSLLNNLDNANYYLAKTGASVIKFEMEARGYTCK